MIAPTFAAAHAAAIKVLPHLGEHLVTVSSEGFGASRTPDADTVAIMLDAAFWASLRREEGYSPKISLAFVAPDQVPSPLTFARPLPVLAQPLTRLAPALERPGIHLGIWHDGEELSVWGATRHLPPYCFVIEVVGPGLLVIKHSRESSKFLNVAVIEGNQIKVIDQRAATRPDCPDLLTQLLGLHSHYASKQHVNVLIQLATSMRAHGRGGTLLVVPADTSHWAESILSPITYEVVPAFSGLSDLMQVDPRERRHNSWQDPLRRAVEAFAGLTAVDGATIISDNHHLLAFGAKIIRRDGLPQVDRVIVTEPIEDSVAVITEPAHLGGTRHLSAAQFAHDQRDAIALVASQDGRFTVFGWSPCEDMVHAHRIETLLL